MLSATRHAALSMSAYFHSYPPEPPSRRTRRTSRWSRVLLLLLLLGASAGYAMGTLMAASQPAPDASRLQAQAKKQEPDAAAMAGSAAVDGASSGMPACSCAPEATQAPVKRRVRKALEPARVGSCLAPDGSDGL